MAFVDEYGDDRDSPLPSDIDAGDPEDDVVECPSCGQTVYDYSEKCPHCGDWIIDTAGPARLHWVWWIAAVVALLSFVAAYVL